MNQRGMMRILLGLAFSTLTWSVGAASDEPKVADPSLSQQLENLKARQAEVRKSWLERSTKSRTAEERELAVAEYLATSNRVSDEALRLAATHPDDPAAVPLLIFVIRTARGGPSDHSERALTLLARDHVRSPSIGEGFKMLTFFYHIQAAEVLLRSVLAENPSRDVKGRACQGLALYLDFQSKLTRLVRDDSAPNLEERAGAVLGNKDPVALEREAERLFERVVAEFGDIKSDRGTLADEAKGYLFEIRHLGIGKRAPEIEGDDIDGRRMKLSDYRGKVVVLCFWGTWCGPCMGLVPHERSLVKRMEARPFALLGINSDPDRSTLKHRMAEERITWPSWWDGGSAEGPIALAWNVQGWPTIYVLDAEGVIRYKNVRERRLDEAVDSLLEEWKETVAR